jgi:hypothetical protein
MRTCSSCSNPTAMNIIPVRPTASTIQVATTHHLRRGGFRATFHQSQQRTQDKYRKQHTQQLLEIYFCPGFVQCTSSLQQTFNPSHANSPYSCPRFLRVQGKTSKFLIRSVQYALVRSFCSSPFARSLPVCDCCIVIDMVSLAAEYGAKLKECEEILATMPVSAVKSKADAVQHLLNDNTNLMSGVFESPMCAAHYFFNSTIMVPL